MIPSDQGMLYAVVNGNGVNVVANGSAMFMGYTILGNAGAFTMDVYDNASAASGQKVVNGLSVASAAEKVLSTGILMANGIVANMSGDPTDNLILIYYKR